jgi:hypothetical protein
MRYHHERTFDLWAGLLAVALFTGCATTSATNAKADEREEPVRLEDCPPAVQASLLAEAFKAGGVLGEIERETEADGQVAYEGTVKLNGGGEVEAEVAPDGRVLEVDRK